MNINVSRMILRPAAGLGLIAVFLAGPMGRRAKARAETPVPSAESHWIETRGSASAQTPETVIQDWPEASRTTARAMIARYGPPSRFSDSALVWTQNGAWRKTVVYRTAWPHTAAKRDKDYLKQSIGYRVPEGKIEGLKRFDRRLRIDRGANELSFQSESERTNFLALNLADEIVTEKRSVEDARNFFRKTERLESSGKTSPYYEGFLFPVPNERVAYP